MTQEALKLALEALKACNRSDMKEVNKAIAAIKQALAQLESQEPFGWLYSEGFDALKAGKCWTAYGTKQDDANSIPIYTYPPQRTWVGLTDEEREEIALEVPMDAVCITEAKLKQENGYAEENNS
jgi:hypothetical protein